jgi:hypothetical protein
MERGALRDRLSNAFQQLHQISFATITAAAVLIDRTTSFG